MAAPMTNTVHVALPEGCDLAATHTIFERFGEVERVDLLPQELAKVAIVYFDVRSAARAIEALGTSYCVPGPQTGERSVRLLGDTHFDSADFAGISSVSTANEEDGTYVLEFFDFRDAARYQAKVVKPTSTTAEAAAKGAGEVSPPPGLGKAQKAQRKATQGADGKAKAAAASPQLPPGLSAPPGLQPESSKAKKAQPAAAAAAATLTTTVGVGSPLCKVTISGLPNKLLSHPMMEAILQQAGFDDKVVTSFSTKNGKPCGEVTVHFLCEAAAHRCIAHFQGCQWDQSGNGVTATFVRLQAEKEKPARQARSTPAVTSSDKAESATAAAAAVAAAAAAGAAAWQQSLWQPDIDLLAFQQLLEANLAAAYSSEDALCSSALSVKAPAWTPSKKAAKGKAMLHAEAPAFVPGCLGIKGGGEAPIPSRRQAKKAHGAGSDTSTEFGESEDEKESPKHLAPAVVK